MQRFLASVSFILMAVAAFALTPARSLVCDSVEEAVPCLVDVDVDSAGGNVTAEADGALARYSAMIEMPKAYLSGICVVRTDTAGVVTGCLFNEFGISALEFIIKPGDKNAQLLSVLKMLDKWYIKRVLSRDLVLLFDRLAHGETTYCNERRHITYKFTPITADDTQE